MKELLNKAEKTLKDQLFALVNWFEKPIESSRRTIGYQHAKEICYLSYCPSDTDQLSKKLEKAIKALKKDNKKITLLFFTDFVEAESDLPTSGAGNEVQYFSYKDFSWAGKVISEELQSLLQQPYDYLYFDSDVELPTLLYFLKHTHSKCRIGVYHPYYQKHIELSIKQNGDENFADLLLHYSRALSNSTL